MQPSEPSSNLDPALGEEADKIPEAAQKQQDSSGPLSRTSILERVEERRDANFYYGFTPQGDEPISKGWLVLSNNFDLELKAEIQVHHKQNVDILKNHKKLVDYIGVDCVPMLYNHTYLQNEHGNVEDVVCEQLMSVVDLVKKLRQSHPSHRGWYAYSREYNHKLQRFCGTVLTKSRFYEKFSINDLFNTICYRESTNSFVLMPPDDDISYTEKKFQMMVLDVTSLMVLFCNYKWALGTKPKGNETFASDVPKSYESFRNYLVDQKFANYDARMSFQCPFFWSDLELYQAVLISSEQYQNDKTDYDDSAYRYFYDWKNLKQGSVLDCFYQSSKNLRVPPNYPDSADVFRFFRNAWEHLKSYASLKENQAFIVEAFEDELMFSWKLFRTNLHYLKVCGLHPSEKESFISDLGFSY